MAAAQGYAGNTDLDSVTVVPGPGIVRHGEAPDTG